MYKNSGCEKCTFEPLSHSLFHSIHKFENIFVCKKCVTYHVCDGGDTCSLIDTGETYVCTYTGNCTDVPAIKYVTIDNSMCKNSDENTAVHLQNTLNTIICNLYYYFTEVVQIEKITSAIFDSDKNFQPCILDLIFASFQCCHALFNNAECNDSVIKLVTSMYVHLIISVYANQTVYGSKLFKSTKNKKHDVILKQMREAWMSTLVTSSSSKMIK